MSVGQIISGTFGIVKDRFGPLLGLWALFFAITMALFVALGIGFGITGMAAMAGSSPLAAGGGMVLLAVLFYLGYLLLAMAQYAALIALSAPANRLTVGEALGVGLRAAPALLLLLVVLLIGYFAVAIVLGIVGAAFSALGNWGSALFALLLFPVLIWVGCRLSPMFAVAAVEGVRNPFKVIGRSWRLTDGHALTIFLASLVFAVILLLVCGVALLPSIGLLFSLADAGSLAGAEAVAPAFGGMALLFVGFMVASVLFNVCYCAFLAVIHGTLSDAPGEGVVEAFA
jgi:hypothetical protein